MWRLAILLHVIIAPTIMGALMLAVMLVPLFQGALGKWILIESLIGFVVSAPVSVVAARANIGKFARS
jgi:hypothetical protein